MGSEHMVGQEFRKAAVGLWAFEMDEGSEPRIPIIATTANAFAEDRKAALEAGMNAHIPKPIDVTMLANVMAEWMH